MIALALILHLSFLAFYTAMSAALFFHWHTYAVAEPQLHAMRFLFIIVSLLFVGASTFFFFRVDWVLWEFNLSTLLL